MTWTIYCLVLCCFVRHSVAVQWSSLRHFGGNTVSCIAMILQAMFCFWWLYQILIFNSLHRFEYITTYLFYSLNMCLWLCQQYNYDGWYFNQSAQMFVNILYKIYCYGKYLLCCYEQRCVHVFVYDVTKFVSTVAADDVKIRKYYLVHLYRIQLAMTLIEGLIEIMCIKSHCFCVISIT